jgi:hypothetical protein
VAFKKYGIYKLFAMPPHFQIYTLRGREGGREGRKDKIKLIN